jgi:SAM-dependent methyltransferase
MRYTRWYSYWSNRTDPEHSRSHVWWSTYAEELRVLWSGRNINSVLEFGCGSGELYKLLGFDKTSYFGVDFSPSMLSRFRASHPEANLRDGDAANYRDENRYDLIFSNAMAQFLSSRMIERHLLNAAGMLAPGGVIVVASIPWRELRSAYVAGRCSPPFRTKPIQMIRSRVASALGRGGMGIWHNPSEFHVAAASSGLEMELFGSLHYPYRFHAAFVRNSD